MAKQRSRRPGAPQTRVNAKENAQRPTPNPQRSTKSVPIALTVAGSDSSAGAGIQADLKTFSALGVYALTAVTCVVAEIPGKVSRIEPVNARIVREQIDVLVNNFKIGAIKTGLLCSAEIICAVASAMQRVDKLSAPRIPIVVDPVIVATSGDPLLDPTAIETYEKKLFSLASLITPNLDEAQRLLGTNIQDRESMHAAAKKLGTRFGTAILLKGGHLPGRNAVDVLFLNGKIIEFSAPFVPRVATHGTGCTYSAAITAELARGLPLEKAIRRAKKFVSEAIARHFQWRSKTGKVLNALRH
jgi:hydroxymethylpyrimidine/phosphomethylpyrimidine kinase